MNTYPIWMEGYQVTGNSATASYEGQWKGKTFEDACSNWANAHVSSDLYNPKSNTYWGCKLYDNEVDARRAFG